MKKIIEIKGDNNSFSVDLKGEVSYVKVYDQNRRLLRFSRGGSTNFEFNGKAGKYILETDGEIGEAKDAVKDDSQILKRLYPYLEYDPEKDKNLLTLKGVPFYYNENMDTFIKRMVKDEKELKGYLANNYKKLAVKKRKKLISDADVIESLILNKKDDPVKITLTKFDEEIKRIETNIGKAKGKDTLVKITPKFPKKLIRSAKTKTKSNNDGPDED